METINDITAEMREFADVDAHTIGRDVLRRRIQHFARRIDEAVTNCNQLKMREALVEIRLLLAKVPLSIKSDIACGIINSKVKHALSTPPRNCDRFGNWEDALRAYEQPISPRWVRDWTQADWMKWAQWLFAEAKGGNDGPQ